MRRLCAITIALAAPSLSAATWYVRPDGGARDNPSNKVYGACDGRADQSYVSAGAPHAFVPWQQLTNYPAGAIIAIPGYNGATGYYWTASTGGTSAAVSSAKDYFTGTNQPDGTVIWKRGQALPRGLHCAFSDPRFFYSDGTYNTGSGLGWQWVGTGGDTYLIRGSIGSGNTYRIGYSYNGTYTDANGSWGVAGAPIDSNMPAPPSGSSGAHTKILGENYAACTSATAKTQLHGGWGLYAIMRLAGVSYLDVACLDFTDFSACGGAGQIVKCDSSQDYARFGILTNNTTHDFTMTDVNLHGFAYAGLQGATGGNVIYNRINILGNAGSGFNADDGSRTTGFGSLLVENYNISWNGCAEEYPIVDAVPYGDCTDQESGGYGDGFGTTTKDSDPPGWQVRFDQGTVSYNTQDGLDALHIGGKGSSMTVTHTLSFGNMGQQIKVGGATATITGSIIVGNCRALKEKIPGTRANFNAKLTMFCRAGDSAIAVNVPDNQPAVIQRNVIYSNNQIALEIDYPEGRHSDGAVQYDHNILIGYKNERGNYPMPVYSGTDLKMFTNPGGSFSHNTTFRANSSWSCPSGAVHETFGSCSDPHLKDESWHAYGYPDNNVAPGAAGSSEEHPASLVPGKTTTLVWEGAGATALFAAAWKGFGFRRRGKDD